LDIIRCGQILKKVPLLHPFFAFLAISSRLVYRVSGSFLWGEFPRMGFIPKV